MKKGGDADAAATVKALAKPTLPVWLVNRLARERKAGVRELVKAGERLREAHAGGDLGAFRDATTRERDAVLKLTAAARELAEGEGRRVSEAMLARVGVTLHAAAADEEARFRLAQGRLTEELEPPGFELLTGLAPAQAPARGKGAKGARDAPAKAERRRQLAAAKEELAAAQAEARGRRNAAGAAERAAERARQELERAEAALEQAKRRVDELA